MPVEFIKQGKRQYEYTCDKCDEGGLAWVKNKQVLRDTLRDCDWIWRDTGILGIVECICPECQKK